MTPTPTPRLALLKPDPNDLYDITIHNGNMDKLDIVGGITVCTSSTRPSSPFTGQQIYETDTRLYYVYNAGWQLLPFGTTVCTSSTRPASPFQGQTIYETDTGNLLIRNSGAWVTISRPVGLVAGNAYDAANATLTTLANSTSEQLTGMSVPSATYRVGLLYRITALVEYDNVAGGRLLFKLRQNGVAGAQAGAAQSADQISAATREHMWVTGLIRPTGSDITDTYVLTATRGATNATVPRIFKSTTTRPFIMTELLGVATAMPSV